MLYPMMELMPVAVLQTRMTQASRKGRTYLRRRRESLQRSARCEARWLASGRLLHLAELERGLFGGARAQQGVQGLAALRPRRKSQRGDSATKKPPSQKQDARRHRHPEDAAPRLVFDAESASAVPELRARPRGSCSRCR